jgi:putative flippase GtrA
VKSQGRELGVARRTAGTTKGTLARCRRALAWIRSPELGILGQGMRYALAGGFVAGVYTLTTLVLSQVVGLPFQAALAIGFVTGLVTHYTLQRFFVWVHHEEFALSFHHQLGRYLAIALSQYGLTAIGTDTLPSALGLPTTVVYLAIMFTLAAANFLLFRHRVFHPNLAPDGDL